MTATKDDDASTTNDDAESALLPTNPPATTAGLLFRNRDYTGWWLGTTVSDFGSALSAVAYPLLILAVTGSAARAGFVGSAEGIGLLITMLLGGALADRYSRRTILIAGPLAQALAVSTVAAAIATGHVNIAQLAAVGFIQGLVSGLAGGADIAALRRVVPAPQLPTAFAQLQGRRMAIRLAGPTTGGFLFAVARWVPFLADAISFLASAAGVALIRRPLGPYQSDHTPTPPTDSPDPSPSTAPADPPEPILTSIRAGFRYIRNSPYLRFLSIWAGVANACLTATLLLVIILVRNHHGSATLVGATTSLGAVGGLAGSFLSPRIARHVPGRRLVISISWLLALGLGAMALIPSAWAIGALLAAMFFLLGPINVVFDTYEARMIPDALMGRVTSAINFSAVSIRWLGPLAAGYLAAALTPTTATLIIAAVLAATAVSAHIARGLHVLNQPIDRVTARHDQESSR